MYACEKLFLIVVLSIIEFNQSLIIFFRRGEWHRGRGYDWNGTRFGAPWGLFAPSQYATTSDALARSNASNTTADAPRRW